MDEHTNIILYIFLSIDWTETGPILNTRATQISAYHLKMYQNIND